MRGDTPIDRGYIAIGWHELGSVSSLAPTRQAFKDAYAAAIPNCKPGTIPVSAGQIFRFVHEMKRGDLVVYPSRHDRMINIGKVVGDYQYVVDDDEEYPHRRATEWLKRVSRDEFSQAALYEVGAAMTLFRVSSNSEEFVSALSGKVGTHLIEVDDQTVALIAEQFEESTEDFVIRRLKDAQSSYEFEHFVAHLLQCMGYYARVTKASADGGIDVIAHRDELGFEPPLIKVQCKQSLGTNGRPDVQKLYGAIEKDEKGLFVTLGSYSADARTFEQSKSNLRLLDGKELVELVFAHYDRFSPRYRALIPLKRTYSPGL
ncbi:MAG: restriction endonuclease [Sphingomicrobium sp.]